MAKSRFSDDEMFRGVIPFTFGCAKRLRKRMTPAETALWDKLKDRTNGLVFRRQHAIGRYIADFYCHSVKWSSS